MDAVMRFLEAVMDRLGQLFATSPPDVREAVPELSRLDVLSVILTALTIFLAVAALFGFGLLRAQVQAAAREEAKKEAKSEAKRYLNENGGRLLKEHLADEQVVARLQRQIRYLGLDEVDNAIDVDNDPDWRPSDD